ncbi:MAG: matrixin family metalloprotease [Phycisphaerales bacterium]|nr:matrixin family metalloprotease [Phycisphaerales bacterium]MCB9856531.1 matrixin family metalloprotease [Phycisphaerales bacterium]
MSSKFMFRASGVVGVSALIFWLATSSATTRRVEVKAEAPRVELSQSAMVTDDDLPAEALTLEENIARIRELANGITPSENGMHVCFQEGTPTEVVHAFCEENPLLCGGTGDSGPRFNFSNRWSGTVGTPRALTWSIVPDGVAITSVGGSPGSEVFSRMDSLFANNGGRAVWIAQIQACFDRWAAISGVSYTRITSGGNDWDDGAAWGSSGSSTRGDCRIAMVFLDGQNGVLAFNSFPGSGTGGDMVLDRSELWDATGSNFRFLRDVVMHEHGHGLGFEHVCPIIPNSSGRLMEPFINTTFDGPQHDEFRAVQFAYGDRFESNNTPATATNLGTVSVGQTLTPGTVPSPLPTFTSSLLSIQGNNDVDYYSITTTGPTSINVTVTPVGFSYDSSAQACVGQSGDCCSGNLINSLTMADLELQVISTNGTTVLATADTNGVGLAESLSNVVLGVAGTYYIRVYEGNTPVEDQLYSLSIQVQTSAITQAEISLPNGAPATLTPGQPTTFLVQIDPNDATITPGSEVLVYTFGGSAFSSPLVSLGGNLWEATFPPAVCSDTPAFFISIFSTVASTSGFVRLPLTAPTDQFTPIVSSGVTNIFSDNGNTNMGWTVSGNATAGIWNRGAPAGGGDRGDPATDSDGSGQCWLTDLADGDTDVDGGTTTLTSPVFDLSTGGVISYDYWFNDFTGGLFDVDTYVVEVATDAGGTNWTPVRTYTTASNQWRTDSIAIGSEVPASSTIRVRFSVSDLGTGTVVEGGLDAIEVSSTVCNDVQLPPNAPTGVTASAGQFCDRVELTWNASVDADDYDVYRNTVDNSGSASLLQGGVVSTNFNDTTATPGTTYFYWVQACNGGGCSGFSSPSASGSIAASVGQVVGVNASDANCGSVQVTWTALANATGYSVFRNTVDNGGSAAMIGSSGTTSFNDNTATPGTTYFYFVRGSNICGAGALSSSDSGIALGLGAEPANLVASGDRCDAVGLTWDVVSDAVFYEVFRNTTNNFGSASMIFLLFTPDIDDTTAVPNTNYFYWVRTTNSCGAVTPVTAVQGIRLGGLTNAPSNVAASDDQCGMIRVTWDALVGATSYEVYRNTVDNAGTATSLGTTAATMFDDNTAAAATTYFYYVSALNDCGDGPLSAGDSGITSDAPMAPGNVAATNDECGMIQVTWDSVAGATLYEVFRNIVDDGGTAVSLGTVAVTNFEDLTAADGTTYFYFVSASTDCGDTGLSASASGETGVLGDMNRDGEINGLDAQGFTDAAVGTYDSCADLAAPFGVIDNDDTLAFVALLLGA